MSDNWLFGPPIPITTSGAPDFKFPEPRQLTREEIFEQKVSFVYGQLTGVTKEQVRAVLAAEHGVSSMPQRGTDGGAKP